MRRYTTNTSCSNGYHMSLGFTLTGPFSLRQVLKSIKIKLNEVKMSSQSNQVRVIVLINAKEGKKQELLDLFIPLVNPPRKREGNVTYTFNASIEDPDELLFDEVWESKEAYDKHYNSQQSVDLRAKVQDLVSKPIEFKLYSEITGP